MGEAMIDSEFNRNVNDLMREVRVNIANYGWHATGVFQSEGNDDPEWSPFLYTTGLTDRGWPELVMYGLDAHSMHGVVKNVIDHCIVTDEAPRAGMQLNEILGSGLPLRLRGVLDGEFGITEEYYKLKALDGEAAEPEYLQVVWPDAEGTFPGERNFGYPSWRQREDLMDVES
jgi:hypothetical protein